jgi:hypothetical protein
MQCIMGVMFEKWVEALCFVTELGECRGMTCMYFEYDFKTMVYHKI